MKKSSAILTFSGILFFGGIVLGTSTLMWDAPGWIGLLVAGMMVIAAVLMFVSDLYAEKEESNNG